MSCRDVEPRNVQQEKQERSPNSKLAFHYWRGRDYYWSRWWWWQSGTEVHRETTFAFTRTVPVRGPSQPAAGRENRIFFSVIIYVATPIRKHRNEQRKWLVRCVAASMETISCSPSPGGFPSMLGSIAEDTSSSSYPLVD